MFVESGRPAGASRVVLGTVLCVMMLALPAMVRGQATTGTVTGTVKDAQGGILPGATLVLISESRGTRSTVVATNGSGDYIFPNVAPDVYAVEVTMSGFKTMRRGGIAVSPGDRLTVPVLELQLGGASETVNVTAEAPLIQAQSGEQSLRPGGHDIGREPPIASRSFTGLVGLAPGMNGTAPSSAVVVRTMPRLTASASSTRAATAFGLQ